VGGGAGVPRLRGEADRAKLSLSPIESSLSAERARVWDGYVVNRANDSGGLFASGRSSFSRSGAYTHGLPLSAAMRPRRDRAKRRVWVAGQRYDDISWQRADCAFSMMTHIEQGGVARESLDVVRIGGSLEIPGYFPDGKSGSTRPKPVTSLALVALTSSWVLKSEDLGRYWRGTNLGRVRRIRVCSPHGMARLKTQMEEKKKMKEVAERPQGLRVTSHLIYRGHSRICGNKTGLALLCGQALTSFCSAFCRDRNLEFSLILRRVGRGRSCRGPF